MECANRQFIVCLRYRILDLAKNQFTLDTGHQLQRFTTGLQGLVNLTALSVAYNKIQDVGFAALVDTLLYTNFHALARQRAIRMNRINEDDMDEEEKDDDDDDGVIITNRVSFFNHGSDTHSLASHRSSNSSHGQQSLASHAQEHATEHDSFKIKYLDITGCFLTTKSEPKLVQLLESHPKPPPSANGGYSFDSQPYSSLSSSGLPPVANNSTPNVSAESAHHNHQSHRRQDSVSTVGTGVGSLPSIVIPETPGTTRSTHTIHASDTPSRHNSIGNSSQKSGHPLVLQSTPNRRKSGGLGMGSSMGISINTGIKPSPKGLPSKGSTTMRSSASSFTPLQPTHERVEPSPAHSSMPIPATHATPSHTTATNKLPLEKIYLAGNLFQSARIADIEDRFKLITKCALVLQTPVEEIDADLSGKKKKLTLLQRKYLSEEHVVSYSCIDDLSCYDLNAMGIVKNRDAATRLV